MLSFKNTFQILIYTQWNAQTLGVRVSESDKCVYLRISYLAPLGTPEFLM